MSTAKLTFIFTTIILAGYGLLKFLGPDSSSGPIQKLDRERKSQNAKVLTNKEKIPGLPSAEVTKTKKVVEGRYEKEGYDLESVKREFFSKHEKNGITFNESKMQAWQSITVDDGIGLGGYETRDTEFAAIEFLRDHPELTGEAVEGVKYDKGEVREEPLGKIVVVSANLNGIPYHGNKVIHFNKDQRIIRITNHGVPLDSVEVCKPKTAVEMIEFVKKWDPSLSALKIEPLEYHPGPGHQAVLVYPISFNANSTHPHNPITRKTGKAYACREGWFQMPLESLQH